MLKFIIIVMSPLFLKLIGLLFLQDLEHILFSWYLISILAWFYRNLGKIFNRFWRDFSVPPGEVVGLQQILDPASIVD